MAFGIGLEVASQVAGLAGILLGLPFVVSKLRESNLSRRVQLADLGSQLIQRVNNQDSHDLEVELSFNALFGRLFNRSEIEALVALPNPLDMIEKRLEFSGAVEFSNKKFVWRGNYGHPWIRVLLKYFLYATYVIFALLFFYNWWPNLSSTPSLETFVYLGIAIVSLWQGFAFARITEFMKSANTHSLKR